MDTYKYSLKNNNEIVEGAKRFEARNWPSLQK